MSDRYLYFAAHPQELYEILLDADQAKTDDLFVAGRIDLEQQRVDLFCLDGVLIKVPFSFFEPSGDGTTPNFGDPGICDHGQTVRFGGYEAANDEQFDEFKPF